MPLAGDLGNTSVVLSPQPPEGGLRAGTVPGTLIRREINEIHLTVGPHRAVFANGTLVTFDLCPPPIDQPPTKADLVDLMAFVRNVIIETQRNASIRRHVAP